MSVRSSLRASPLGVPPFHLRYITLSNVEKKLNGKNAKLLLKHELLIAR